MTYFNEKLKKLSQYLIFAFNLPQTLLQGERASKFYQFPSLGCSFSFPSFMKFTVSFSYARYRVNYIDLTFQDLCE